MHCVAQLVHAVSCHVVGLGRKKTAADRQKQNSKEEEEDCAKSENWLEKRAQQGWFCPSIPFQSFPLSVSFGLFLLFGPCL